MKHLLSKSGAALIAILMIPAIANSQDVKQKSSAKESFTHDTLFVHNLVSKYTHSIDVADTALGSAIWAHTAEVSFTNPRGNEYGWENIKKIYAFFQENFSSRKLTFNHLRFTNYGDVMWLEFFWTFDSKTKPDGKAIQTKGRETQIWKKVNTDWRLVHVHYSGMPVTTT